MGIFSRSKLNSDEYLDLSSKIVKLNSDMLMLQHLVEKIEVKLKFYHGKLTRMQHEEEEEEPQMDAATQQRRLLGFE